MNKDSSGRVSGSRASTEPQSVSALSGFDPARIVALAERFGKREAAKVAERVEANELERNTIGCFEHLVRHGYKFIDIIVRKDGQETRFEGDWIARLFDPSREEWLAAIATEAGTATTPQSGVVHEGAGPKDIAQNEAKS
jgi:hypothetical protein